MSDYYTNNDDINSYADPNLTNDYYSNTDSSNDYYSNISQPNDYSSNNQSNDYYTNTGKQDSYYDSTDKITEDDLVNKNFVIQINKPRLIAHIIGLLIPFIFYLMCYRFIKYAGDYGTYITCVLFIFFLLFLGFFIVNVGKKIEIIDKTIIITRLFYRKELISRKDITKCEVITGLTSYGRYHSEDYNKVVIYYVAEGKERKVDMTDNLYTCYNELVRYMDYFVKCDFIDGRSAFARFFDNNR